MPKSLFWVGKLQQSKVGGGAKARLQSRRDCGGAAAQGAAEAAAHGNDDACNDDDDGGRKGGSGAELKFAFLEIGAGHPEKSRGFRVCTKFKKKKKTFETD